MKQNLLFNQIKRLYFITIFTICFAYANIVKAGDDPVGMLYAGWVDQCNGIIYVEYVALDIDDVNTGKGADIYVDGVKIGQVKFNSGIGAYGHNLDGTDIYIGTTGVAGVSAEYYRGDYNTAEQEPQGCARFFYQVPVETLLKGSFTASRTFNSSDEETSNNVQNTPSSHTFSFATTNPVISSVSQGNENAITINLGTYTNTCSNWEYEVYKDGTLLKTIDKGGTLSFTDYEVQPCQEYTYQVKIKTAFTGGRVMTLSSTEVTGFAVETASTNTASLLTASSDLCDAININWEWTANENPTAFHIYDGTTKVAQVDGSIREYKFDEGTLGASHIFKIRTENCKETGSYSGTVAGSTKTSPTPPSVLTATENHTLNIIDLTWNDPNTTEDKYIIKRVAINTGSEIFIEKGADDISHTDEDINSCEKYIYTIYAANNCLPDGLTNFLDKRRR